MCAPVLIVVALAALAVAVVAIVAAALAQGRQERSHASERADWCEERRSLLDRIQHPHVVQRPREPVGDPPPPPVDESAWAGTVRRSGFRHDDADNER